MGFDILECVAFLTAMLDAPDRNRLTLRDVSLKMFLHAFFAEAMFAHETSHVFSEVLLVAHLTSLFGRQFFFVVSASMIAHVVILIIGYSRKIKQWLPALYVI